MRSIYEETHNSIGLPLTVYRMTSREKPQLIYCNWHKELEFIYVSKGELTLIADHKRILLREGEIGVVNIHEVHYSEQDSAQECEVYVFLVSPEQILSAGDPGSARFLKSLLEGEILISSHITPDMPRYTEILACLRRMYALYTEKGPGFQLLAVSLIYELLYEIFSGEPLFFTANGFSHTQTQEKIRRLKKALTYVEQNYSRKIYIKELADLLYMGEDSFYAFFVSVTGTSPAGYIRSYRMKQAAALLSGTELPITEICYCVGFSNVSYFIKAFREYSACTPKKYRTLQQKDLKTPNRGEPHPLQ